MLLNTADLASTLAELTSDHSGGVNIVEGLPDSSPAIKASSCSTGSRRRFPGAICRAKVASRRMPAAQAEWNLQQQRPVTKAHGTGGDNSCEPKVCISPTTTPSSLSHPHVQTLSRKQFSPPHARNTQGTLYHVALTEQGAGRHAPCLRPRQGRRGHSHCASFLLIPGPGPAAPRTAPRICARAGTLQTMHASAKLSIASVGKFES